MNAVTKHLVIADMSLLTIQIIKMDNYQMIFVILTIPMIQMIIYLMKLIIQLIKMTNCLIILKY